MVRKTHKARHRDEGWWPLCSVQNPNQRNGASHKWGVSFLLNQTSLENPHRRAQRFVSMVILDPVMLTTATNHYILGCVSGL